MTKNCKQILENSNSCGSYAMNDGSGFCISHNPAARDIKELAVKKGGFAIKKQALPQLPSIEIQSKADVPRLLTTVIEEVRHGTIDLKSANTLGYLAGILIKAYELTDMQEKIEEIERIVLERKRTY